MIAEKKYFKETPVSRSRRLTRAAILIAILLSGCAGLRSRLGFGELASGPVAAGSESRSGQLEKPPVELSGAIEKRNIEFNIRLPLFVW